MVMLLINNRDKPGFLGALATMLGDASINIATFHLGRQAAEQDAIALVGVDQVVPYPIQRKLRELPHVRYVKVLRLDKIERRQSLWMSCKSVIWISNRVPNRNPELGMAGFRL